VRGRRRQPVRRAGGACGRDDRFAYAGGVVPGERLQDADVVFDDMRELPRLLGGK
jgi:hypothetical protein